MKDMKKISESQDPQDAIEKETGTYKDSVEDMPIEERLGTDVWPMDPGPNPIKGAR